MEWKRTLINKSFLTTTAYHIKEKNFCITFNELFFSSMLIYLDAS